MMKKSAKRVGSFKILGWKNILVCALCGALFLGILQLNLHELMKLGEENAYRNCQNSYLLASRELSDYLRMADDAVASAARRIEEMRAGGASDEDILAYMLRETGNLDSKIAGPTTGVYGYIDGVYLDGTGWVPEPGYEPTKRPWYIGAVNAGGSVTHVPPFDNLQTGSLTITVCRLLSDGVSVVAMDLPTDNLQRSVSKIAQEDTYYKSGDSSYAYKKIFVMDSGGVIIAHSDEAETLKNYAASDDPAEREIARQILENKETYFMIEDGGETLIYCGGELDGGWYVFSVLEYSEVVRQTTRNTYLSVAVAIIGIAGMIVVMIRLALRRYHEAIIRDYATEVEEENQRLTELMRARQETAEARAAYEEAKSTSAMYSSVAHALSSSYSYLYYVDLETDEYDDYSREIVDEALPEDKRGHDFFNVSRMYAQQLLHPDDQEEFLSAFTKENILRALDTDGSFQLTYRQMIDREASYVTMSISRMKEDDRHILVGVTKNGDIDVRNELTGLRTEAALHVRGRELLREHPEGWCIICLDLEHFRLFNEWYGRDAGDRLLAQIGERLIQVEADTDGLTCYLGQDDFTLFVPYDEESVQRFFADIHEYIMEHGTSVGFMPAIGVCMADDGSSVEELYDHALQASQHAKEDYHHRIRIFEESMYQKTEQDYQILSDFQQGLQNDELFIVLQPQCEAESGKIVGAESLVRWKQSDGKIISPGVFVPILERYGFVTDLDQFVWEEVCKWQRQWLDEGHTPLPVSVNVSQIDIYTIDVPAYLELLMWKYKLPMDTVKVEITESAYAGDGTVAETVRRLREKGFLVLMDDFGSGYSSLNMLRSLNVDVIKLDAMFLRMNGDDNKGKHILESVVGMAKSMESPIIVEGVETEDEMTLVKSLGCRYVQGYYFYRPMPVADFAVLIGDEGKIDTSGFRL